MNSVHFFFHLEFVLVENCMETSDNNENEMIANFWIDNQYNVKTYLISFDF